jgi:hypothetical protein
MIQKVFNWTKVFSLAILAFTLTNCQPTKTFQPSTYYSPNYQSGGYDQHSGLGFQIPDKYPIEILQGTDQPKTSFQEIEKLSISEEYPLSADQEYKGRMLKRGNDQQEKEAILARLVAQAQDLGASGIMNVNYKVFSTATTSGYILSGIAFRYVLKQTVRENK